MSTSQLKTLDDFVRLKNRNALSNVIRTAVDLGIIEALDSGQKTVDQLAAELDLNQEPLARLMNVLAMTELVEQYGDDFALATIGKLIPKDFLDFGDHHWQQLSKHVRDGVPLPAADALPHQDRDYRINKASEEWTLTPVALDAAEALDVGKSRRGLRILEIACGSAVFALTFAHRDPDSVANLLDDPEGLPLARQTVESIGLDRQVVMIETEDPFDLANIPALQEQTFDLVLLVGVLHRLNSDECADLLHKVQPLVKPERELAIVDIFPGQENGEMNRAIFELELGLRTSAGQLHDPQTLEAALKSAGFGYVQYAHLPSAPHYWGLMLAQRI